MQTPVNKRKNLSVLGLIAINVVAVDSLRTLPFGAEYGFTLIFFYLLAGITFFIPSALVSAELATGWPNRGGIYVWVREAFGLRAALVTIWLQWIYNIVWYPTILSFIAATITFLFDPSLAENKTFMLIGTLSVFWLMTLINFMGMRTSAWLSTVGAIIGTLLPMTLIMILGLYWIAHGNFIYIDVSWNSFFPTSSGNDNLGFFIAILFGLLGLEMSAAHADEVRKPKRDYPLALLISTFLILFSLIGASLSIAIILPKDQISIVSGLISAFANFFAALGLSWVMPIIVLMIVIGAFAGVSSWIIGPTKGLLVASEDGSMPTFLRHTNKHNVPTTILLLQAMIFSVLCSVFIIMPTVSSSFWLLSAMTAQLALLSYAIMFAAAIRLRYQPPPSEDGGLQNACKADYLLKSKH